MVCEWFSLKTTRTVFAGLALKPVTTVFSSLTLKLMATVSLGLASKPMVSFLVESQNQCGVGFCRFGPQNRQLWFGDLGLKPPRRFLGFGLKTKWASICRLHHKIDGGRSAWNTCQDLAACFTWKQVWLEFPSLAWRLTETWRWVVHVTPSWRLRQRQVKDERVDATGYVRPCYPSFVVFNVLSHRRIVVI
jgi:hypothetical protein